VIRIFSQPDNHAAELRLRVLRLLSHALELNLLEGRGLPTSNLKDSLTRLCEALEKELPEPNVLLQAGETSTNLQQYFLQLTRSLDALATDLSHGIRVLEEAMTTFDGEQSNHLSRLEAASRSLGKVRSLDDIQLLQKQFEDSLAAFRQSQSRHHGAISRAMDTLRETSQQVPGAPPKLVFAVFHLRRLDRMRERFGAALVQELFDYFNQLLASRWPTLEDPQPLDADSLIVFDTKDLALERHRHAMRRLSSERIVYATTHRDREYILPIAFDWLVNFAESKPHAESQAQAFLAQQSQKEREILHLDQILKS
jgi:hypothetical protein